MTNDSHMPSGRDEQEAKALQHDSANSATMSPLPGEAGIPSLTTPRRAPMSRKGLFAVALLVVSLIAATTATVQRVSGSGRKADDTESRLTRDKPAAASAEPRRLDMPAVPPQANAGDSAPRIPALTATAEELGEPIGVRRTGAGSPASGTPRVSPPEDAPVLLVSTRPGALPPSSTAGRARTGPDTDDDTAATHTPTHSDDPMAATTRNLRDYQRRLQGVLEGLTSTAGLARGQVDGELRAAPQDATPATSAQSNGSATGGGGLFGGQLQGSSTPRVAAGMLGNRSFTLPKGTAFTCALKTKVVSASSGLVGCEVQRNLYSDDGRVLLVERGSHMDGEYRVTSLRPGAIRIPVLWTRIRTPLGVIADIESPGTGQLGESGIDGHVDKRWGERIGAAMMLSLIDDSVKLLIQNQAQERQASTIILPSTTANTSKLAEKVLDSTINIPPLIYQNQGGIVGIYVARDIDFSNVYELAPTPLMKPPGPPVASPQGQQGGQTLGPPREAQP